MSKRAKPDLVKGQIIRWKDGSVGANVQWSDKSNTTGPIDNPHMQALFDRIRREGKPIEEVRW